MEKSSFKCKCAALNTVVLGKTSKLPIKYAEYIAGKPHPEGFTILPTGGSSISLFRCEVCSQYWQADGMQGRIKQLISWPLVCIKISDSANWKTFNDYSLRKQHFPEIGNDVTRFRRCATEKCNSLPVKGLHYCANCACLNRSKGIALLPIDE
jgi:hypothetical protein